MEMSERLRLSKILIGEMDKLVENLDPYDDIFDEIMSRALHAKMKMKMFYAQHGEPPELQEQIDAMCKHIKKLEEMQTKRGTFY